MGIWSSLRRNVVGLFASEIEELATARAEQIVAGSHSPEGNLVERANPVIESILSEAFSVGRQGGLQPLDQNYEQYLRSAGLFHPVWACVDARASAAASVPVKVMRRTGDGESEELTDHPLADLLENPNPEQGAYSFRYQLAQAFDLTGESYIITDTPFSRRLEAGKHDIWVARPDRMDPVPDKSRVRTGKEGNPISHWVYGGWVGEPVELKNEQVVQFRRPNPFDAFRGLSPLKELETLLSTMYEVNLAVASYFENGMRPGGIVSTERPPGQDQLDRVKLEFAQLYAGSKNRSKIVWIHGQGVSYDQLADSLADAMPLELMEYLKREVQSVYKVPNFALADPDGSTWANSREQSAMFFRNAIQPLNTMIFGTLNASDFVRAWGEGIYLEPDYTQVEALQPDLKAQAERDVLYKRNGIQTANEIRELRQMGGPLEGGDTLDSNSASVPDFADLSEEEREAELLELSPTQLRQLARRTKNKDEARGIMWRAIESRRAELQAAIEVFALDGLRQVEQSTKGSLAALRVVSFDGEGGERTEKLLGDDRVPNSWVDLLTFDWAALYDIWFSGILPLARRVFQQGAEDNLEEINGLFVPFDMEVEEVREFVSTHTATRVTNILDTQRDEVRAIVEEAVENGKTIDELSASLTQHFTGMSGSRARLIARTETVGIYNTGSLAGIRASGAQMKEWLASRDDSVRATHVEADAQQVPVGADFRAGTATGPVPGRMSEVKENANCRCAVTVGDV